MTVVIRIGDELFADSAIWIDGHVYSRQKIFELQDGTKVGGAGRNPTESMLHAKSADEFVERFREAIESRTEDAWILIRPEGACLMLSVQAHNDRFVCAEDFVDTSIVVGCYRTEWHNYVRNRPVDRASAMSFCSLINEINGL